VVTALSPHASYHGRRWSFRFPRLRSISKQDLPVSSRGTSNADATNQEGGDRNKALCSNTALADQLVSPRSVESHPTLPNHLQTQTTKSAPRSLRSCRSVRAPPLPVRSVCMYPSSLVTPAPQVSSTFLQHHHRPIRPRAVQWVQVLGTHQAHRSIAPAQTATGEHQTRRAASLPCSSSLRSDSFRHTSEAVAPASNTAGFGYSLDYWSWPTPFLLHSGGGVQLRAPLIPRHCWMSLDSREVGIGPEP
jgi:hypothetical protein